MNAPGIKALVPGSAISTDALAQDVEEWAVDSAEGDAEGAYVTSEIDCYDGEAIVATPRPNRLETCLAAFFRGDLDVEVGLELGRIRRDFLAGRSETVADFYRTALLAGDPLIRQKVVDMIGTHCCEEGSVHALRLLATLARSENPIENVFFWLMQAYDHYGREDALPALAQAAEQKLIALLSLKALEAYGQDSDKSSIRNAIANLDVSAYGTRAAQGNKNAAKALVYLHRAGNSGAIKALRKAAERNEFARMMLAVIENENPRLYRSSG